MKTIKSLALVFAAAFALTSCSSSSDDVGGNVTPTPEGNTTKVLHIAIKGNNSTRATGTISNDVIANVDEAKMNNLLIGIYDNTNGTLERLQPITTISSQEIVNGVYQATVTYATASPTIIVMANVPSSVLALGQSSSQLQADTVGLETTANGSTQDGTQLPMIGTTTTITPSTTSTTTRYNEYTATVELNRMVARVDLTGIQATLPAGDSVHVQAVYMRHTQSKSTILNPDNPQATNLFTLNGTPSTSSPVCGFNVTGAVDKEPFAGYSYIYNGYNVSTANETDSVWKNQNKQAYFYVFPNQATVFGNQTQLVIKARYTRWDATTNARTIDADEYYPIVVNDLAGDDVNYVNSDASESGTGRILPNRVYSLTATIIGEGQSEEEYGGGTNPKDKERVRINISVKPWRFIIHQQATVGN